MCMFPFFKALFFAIFVSSLPSYNKCVSFARSSKRSATGDHTNHSFHKRFEGPEHVFLGQQVSLPFPSGARLGKDLDARRSSGGVTFSYGMLLALSGDFFGAESPEAIVCTGPTRAEQIQRAEAIFNQWYLSTSSTALEFSDLVSAECRVVQSFVAAGFTSLSGYKYIQEKYNWRELYETGFALNNNWDHFSRVNVSPDEFLQCNKIAYTAFNLLAQQYACGASSASHACSELRNEQNLKLAYAALAFGHHFLTDAFSGGHTRVPRNQNAYKCHSVVAGMMINSQHNEDNYNGIWANIDGQKVQLFGDASLLLNPDEEHMIESAMKSGISEVSKAFQSGVTGSVDVTMFPVLAPESDQKTCSLFRVQKGSNSIEVRVAGSAVPGQCVYKAFDDCPTKLGWPVMFNAAEKAYTVVRTDKALFYANQNIDVLVRETVKEGSESLMVEILAQLMDCGSTCCSALTAYSEKVFSLPVASKKLIQNHPRTVTALLSKNPCISVPTREKLVPSTEKCRMYNVVNSYTTLKNLNSLWRPSTLDMLLDSHGEYIDSTRTVCSDYDTGSTVGMVVDFAACELSAVKGLAGQIVQRMNAKSAVLASVFETRAPRILMSQLQMEPYLLRENIQPLKSVVESDSSKILSIDLTFSTLIEAAIVDAWKKKNACQDAPGMSAATGKASPFLSGSTLLMKDAAAWTPQFQAHGFSVNGKLVDGPTKGDPKASVASFQELWNEHNPNQALRTDGIWDDDTQRAILMSPAAGFGLSLGSGFAGSTNITAASCSLSRDLTQALVRLIGTRPLPEIAALWNGDSSSTLWSSPRSDPRCQQRLPASSISISIIYRVLTLFNYHARPPKWPILQHCDVNSTNYIARAELLQEFLAGEFHPPVTVSSTAELGNSPAVVVFSQCKFGLHAAGHANLWTGIVWAFVPFDEGFFSSCVASSFLLCPASE